MTATGEAIRAWTLADPPGRDLVTALQRPDALQLVVELAHDLRSPLGSIQLLADMLSASGPLSDGQREHVRLMQAAAHALSALAEDVMELAQSAGEPMQTLGPRLPFEVADVLGTVRDVALPLAVARGLELRVRSAVPGPRLGHPRAMERVLLNLVTNAIKYTDEGWVEIAAAPEATGPGQVCLAVCDSGRGITQDAARALLDPFPVPSARHPRGFSGTGIGLATCRRLVTAMGSSLRLDSQSGRGSRFHLTLALPIAPP